MSPTKKKRSKFTADENPSWESLCSLMDKSIEKKSLAKLWPELKTPASILLWGDDASVQEGLEGSEILNRFGKLLSPAKKKTSKKNSADWQALSLELVDRMKDLSSTGAVAKVGDPSQEATKLEALAVAYAMPELATYLDEKNWWQLLGAIQELRETSVLDCEEGSLGQAMLGAELGLALAYRLHELPTCRRMGDTSWELFTDWLRADEARLGYALGNDAACLRSALATGLRSQRLGLEVLKQKLKRDLIGELNELAVWVALLTRHDGSAAFSRRFTPTTTALLTRAACVLGDEGLAKADRFARRQTKKPTSGLMRVESELPEAAIYNENGHVVVMRPSWFDHHGVVMANFDGTASTNIEISSGKTTVFAGQWQASVTINGKPSQPESGWEEVCWFSDDDVHYLEIEQRWSQGVTLQRQIMVVREDGAVLIGDSVFADTGAKIQYESRLPVADGLKTLPEPETREIIVADTKPRALVLPINLPEWRSGFAHDGSLPVGQLETDDEHLRYGCQGESRLYAPLWIDFERRRYSRPRTWRNLTVASNLEVAAPGEAVASRIQLGSEQWLVFRALGAPNAWTFCGKHIAADFFCGRFDPEDGDVEELVTVEDHAE